MSNANLKYTILKLTGRDYFDKKFVEDTEAVRLNNSSTQVYIGLNPDERIDESMGDLFFTSTSREFRTDLLLSHRRTGRRHRPAPRCTRLRCGAGLASC